MLKAANSTPLSLLLIRNELISFARIASLDYHNRVRDMIFEPDNALTLKESSFLRRRKRPRLSWASEIFKVASQVSGNLINLQSLLLSYAVVSLTNLNADRAQRAINRNRDTFETELNKSKKEINEMLD